jgi:hypothetical protein
MAIRVRVVQRIRAVDAGVQVGPRLV